MHELERGWFTEDDAKRVIFEQEESVYKAALAEAARRRAKGESVAMPLKPEPPRLRRRIIMDATIEAATDISRDNPEGCMGVFDELASWFTSFDAYRTGGRGRDRTHWLESFNGGPRLIDRVKRGRTLVPNWSMGLLGLTQPDPMRRLAGKIDDDGLVQRFNPTFAQRTHRGKDRAPSAKAVSGYHNLVCRLASLRVPEGPYLLSPDAQQVQETLLRTAEDLMVLPTVSAAFRGHLAKWAGMYARWLLLFHLADHVDSERIPRSIPWETAERTFTFMIEFLLPHASRFFVDLLGQKDHIQHARWVAGFILSQKKARLTARDIGRVYRELREDLPAIQRAFAVLTLANWAAPLDSDRRDGPTKWLVNPAVHVLFAARAEEERQRREAVKERIREAARNLGLGVQDAES